jgi:antitoxin (DNA-binding transcriptional repressor) of toxin-antitoxin stability system
MRAVGLKVLKNKLSEYVRLAAGGETVLVTDRDHVVAELGPPGASRASLLPDAQLADLVRRGVLTPASMPCAGPPPSLPLPGATVASLVDELASDRDDR